MNVLCVAAHPDDEVLGCGGTIARLAQEGANVYVSLLGEGVTSRFSKREQADRELVTELQGLARKASRMLGVRDLYLYELPDNRFDSVPLLEVIKIVEGVLDRVQPDVVYTHHGGDLNIDHAIVHRAVLTATRPTSGCKIKEIYTFQVPSSTEWVFGQFQPTFEPNVFVDITSTLPSKLASMRVYESEIHPFPHPRSPESLRIAAQYWGSMVGVAAAEAFKLIRKIIY